jgi:hypothetical protein
LTWHSRDVSLASWLWNYNEGRGSIWPKAGQPFHARTAKRMSSPTRFYASTAVPLSNLHGLIMAGPVRIARSQFTKRRCAARIVVLLSVRQRSQSATARVRIRGCKMTWRAQQNSPGYLAAFRKGTNEGRWTANRSVMGRPSGACAGFQGLTTGEFSRVGAASMIRLS